MRKPSSTKSPSTNLPPPLRLERLLLDGDTHPELEGLLRAAGFNTENVRRIDVDIQDDTAILRRARSDKRILVCHDRHRDRATQQFLFLEMYRRGGRVLRISGDSSQESLEALAKVLLWRTQWLEFFSEHKKGAATVYRDHIVKKTARELYEIVQKDMKLTVKPAETLAHVGKRGPAKPRQTRKPLEGQKRLTRVKKD